MPQESSLECYYFRHQNFSFLVHFNFLLWLMVILSISDHVFPTLFSWQEHVSPLKPELYTFVSKESKQKGLKEGAGWGSN